VRVKMKRTRTEAEKIELSEIISRKTKEGMEQAKENGIHVGRPKEDKAVDEALKLYYKENPIKDILRLTGISKAKLYRRIKELTNDEIKAFWKG